MTIITGGRNCYFGDIMDERLRLSKLGEIANKIWLEIPNQFDFIKIDEYVIMPNHTHGILQIDKAKDVRVLEARWPDNTIMTPKGGITGNKNPMLHDSLSRVIR